MYRMDDLIAATKQREVEPYDHVGLPNVIIDSLN